MLSGETFVLEIWETWVVDPGATFKMLPLPTDAPHLDLTGGDDDLSPLKITNSGQGVTLSWPRIPGAFVLEAADKVFDEHPDWTEITTPPNEADGVYQVTLPVERALQGFRLRAAAPAQ
jgi:hypothetical protein